MKVKFFYTQFCPFCVESKEYIENNNLKVELLDATSDKDAQDELMRIGKKMQVPMLSIDDEALFESSDILQWLKDNTDKLK